MCPPTKPSKLSLAESWRAVTIFGSARLPEAGRDKSLTPRYGSESSSCVVISASWQDKMGARPARRPSLSTIWVPGYHFALDSNPDRHLVTAFPASSILCYATGSLSFFWGYPVTLAMHVKCPGGGTHEVLSNTDLQQGWQIPGTSKQKQQIPLHVMKYINIMCTSIA